MGRTLANEIDPERYRRDMLASLASHEGWKVLREIAAEKEEEFYLRLARMLAAQARPIDQRMIDYKRGEWHGIRWLLDHPTKILEQFEAEQEGDSP